MEKEAIKLVEALHRRQEKNPVTAISADDLVENDAPLDKGKKGKDAKKK